MEKIGKYSLKLIKKYFSVIDKFGHDWEDVKEDGYTYSIIHTTLEHKTGLDGGEVQFLIAAWVINFVACGGEWGELGKTVNPLTPKMKSFDIDRSYWARSFITETGESESYLPSNVRWETMDGYVDLQIRSDEIHDIEDEEIEVEESK